MKNKLKFDIEKLYAQINILKVVKEKIKFHRKYPKF